VPVNFINPLLALPNGQSIGDVGVRKLPAYEPTGAGFKIELVNLTSHPPIFKPVNECPFHSRLSAATSARLSPGCYPGVTHTIGPGRICRAMPLVE